jgi:hypothetical protein
VWACFGYKVAKQIILICSWYLFSENVVWQSRAGTIDLFFVLTIVWFIHWIETVVVLLCKLAVFSSSEKIIGGNIVPIVHTICTK